MVVFPVPFHGVGVVGIEAGVLCTKFTSPFR